MTHPSSNSSHSSPSDRNVSSAGGQAPRGGEGEFFSLELFAELAGVNTRTVLRYQEQGFLRPVNPSDSPDSAEFDSDSLRELRRMEHLRETCGLNDQGLRLILSLLHEVETLRRERRRFPR